MSRKKQFKSLIGNRYGRLTVVGRAENSPSGKARWWCECECGKMKSNPVSSYDLTAGKVKSCGCIYNESNRHRNRIHGMSNSRLHRIWSGMKRRCLANKNYISKNIKVCDEWISDFEAFVKWAKDNGYQENLTIDRINNALGYTPENCRWVDMKTQQNNRTNNHTVLYKGAEYTIAQLAELLGVKSATLLWRINNGWSEEYFGLNTSYKNRMKRGNHCG